MKKIRQIDPVSLDTIATYESISEAAAALGVNASAIHRSCNNPTRTAAGCFFRYCGGMPSGQTRKTSISNKKVVRQFDPHTGELIATYESIREAARATGAQDTAIIMTCKGERNQAGGYYWNYITDNNPPKTISAAPKATYKRSVEQLDPKTKEVVATFDSISGAALAVQGASVSNIIDVCNGKRKTSGGFSWKYQD